MGRLIKNISELRGQVPVNFSEDDLDRLQPFLDQAERQYVMQLIGKAELLSLANVYDAAGNNVNLIVDADVKEAIIICQRIISNLGYLFGVSVLNLSIGATGIQIHSSDTMKTAFQWQINDLKASFQDLGFNAIEELLAHLESNPTKFSDYIASEQYTNQKQFLISTAADFSFYFDIKKSRFLFMSLCSIMFRIEAQDIAKIFGAGFLDSLKADAATLAQKTLANKYIKPAIALLSAAKSIKERIFSYQDGQVVFSFQGSTNNLKESQQVLTEKIQPLCDSLIYDANEFLQDAQAYILANPTKFIGYVPPAAQRRFKAKNDPKKGLFIA